MADPDSALQKLIFETLSADATVTALVAGRIYDRAPSEKDYPCIVFGPSDSNPDDAEGVVGEEITVQLDVWTTDNGRLRPCKEIVGAVKSALHYAPLTLPAPYALVQIWVHLTRVMLDQNPALTHGIVQVTAQVETH